ncbi:hypothetical protein [Beutenbergia cavernae]|uniref:hypothetical protein n=1 Tax=Beutenbergia cavernae TaxID=84757 RepID=UPI00019ACE3B|nr:hypothetical protein [Beutenbergia cavernae]
MDGAPCSGDGSSILSAGADTPAVDGLARASRTDDVRRYGRAVNVVADRVRDQHEATVA